ncbi:serine/threonine-protein kinase BLUS1 [Silene latifolia]|uniref:serine/threonine-protein kinase BLUS1 n=1 Tax=Silene latifolia TaxID=37657 RepID=UPI003D774DBB
MEKEKKKFPIGAEHYTLYEEVGQGVSASVYRALCIPNNEIIAIKILDFERCNSDLNNISREAQTMFLVDHANVLKSHCSFVSDHNLWVIMPYMAGGSCLHILKAAHPDGFEEVVIATILREVLKGLEYLHHHGHIHRDVKAGNILLDSRGAIKLGDLGVSACLFDSGDRQRMRNTFVGTPCWMAPEVMEQLHGYDFKADIWSFGITALELAHGHAPFSKFPPMKVLLMTLQNAPPSLDYERDKKFSKSFKQMIASCLVKDPLKRPSSKKLIRHPFFKQARSNDYIVRTLLEGLPSLGERIKALKKKEEDMLAQKKMPDGEKEELSQNEYKRGISGWNFNLEDLKAQASLIQEDELFDKDQGVGIDGQLEYQFSNEENDHIYCALFNPLPTMDSSNKSSKNLYDKLEDDLSGASSNTEKSTSQCCSPRQVENGEKNEDATLDKEATGKMADSSTLPLHHRRATSSTCAYTLEIPIMRSESFKSPKQAEHISINDVGISTSGLEESASEPTPRTTRASPANSEDMEAKVAVIQQKGRFKVTSENVDLEKTAPSHASLPKSQSLQVIAPTSIMSLPSPISFQSMNQHIKPLFSLLQYFLQTNITQRDNILSMMKQISFGDFNANLTLDENCTSTTPPITEKSLLESAHEREKELLQEITTLHLRLINTQEELQKIKLDGSNVNQ